MKQLKNSTESSPQGYRQELGHWSLVPPLDAPPRPKLRLRQCPGSGPSSKPTGRGQNSLLSLDSGVCVLLLVLDHEPLAPPAVLGDLPPGLIPAQHGSFCPHGQQDSTAAAAGLWEWPPD